MWGLLHRWQKLITFSPQINSRQYKEFGCNHRLNLQSLQPRLWIFRHCTIPASGLCSTDWRKLLGDKKDLFFFITLQEAGKRCCFFWNSPFYFFIPPNVSVQDVVPLGKGLQRVEEHEMGRICCLLKLLLQRWHSRDTKRPYILYCCFRTDCGIR